MFTSVRFAMPKMFNCTKKGQPADSWRLICQNERLKKNYQSDTGGVLEWLMFMLIYGFYILINSFLFQWPKCVSGNEIHMLTRVFQMIIIILSFVPMLKLCFHIESNCCTVTFLKIADGSIWNWTSRHKPGLQYSWRSLTFICIFLANSLLKILIYCGLAFFR